MPIISSPPTATVTNKTVFKRRLKHVYAFFTGKAYVKEADMAESALAWSLCRGLHRTFLLLSSITQNSNVYLIQELRNITFLSMVTSSKSMCRRPSTN
ncbi:unnamed protein product [Aureobasidium vineae]|uniref:Uncharacterized protein n=1 Tax=Aureobasidium vineae TaxID=2773715 RepID=A0A9N8JR86_9PEZI|nr:unnamed protein product [Aureobasidium vineae]